MVQDETLEVLDSLTDGCWVLRLREEGSKISMSPKLLRFLGYARGEKQNSMASWKAIIHPEDRQQTIDAIEAHIEWGASSALRLSLRLINKQGLAVDTHCRVTVVESDTEGRPRCLVGTHLEKESPKPESSGTGEGAAIAGLFEQIVDRIPNIVFVKEAKELRFTVFNVAGQQLLGVKPEGILGKSDLDLFPKEQAERFQEKDREVLKAEQPVLVEEEAIETPSGTRWLRTRKIALLDDKGTPAYLLGISEDVTELMIQSEQLKDKELMLREAQKVSRTGSWRFDVATQTIAWTEQMFEIFGEDIAAGEPSFEKHRSTIHPDDVQMWESTVGKCVSDGEPYLMEFRVVRSADEQVWVRAHGCSQKSTNGQVETLYGTCQDITETKLGEDKLKDKHKFLVSTVDRLPGAFYAKDLDGRYLMVNQVFRDLFDLPDEQILGRTDHDLFTAEIADVFRANDLKVVETKRLVDAEEKIVDSKSDERVYQSFKFPYFEANGSINATGGISLDVTEKKEFERQNCHASKLVAIGELAAGVGHEINNPLTVAVGNVHKIKRFVRQTGGVTPEIEKAFDRVEQAVDRITKIVRGLRTFARDDLDEAAMFSVQDAVEQMIGFIREIYDKEGVDLQVNYPREQIYINGNVGRFQQAMMNLISNAKDATEGQEDRRVGIEVRLEGGVVALVVTDNGCGIAKNLKDKIFNSFFTTKPIGRGTGIGLSLTSSIVKEHQGKIHLDSEEGKGTTFTLRFPLSNEVSDEAQVTQLVPTQTQPIVLVVDDEEAIREVLIEILQELGCRVQEASSGEEAQEKLRSTSFDAVITDLRMPGMSGVQLLQWTRSQHWMTLPFLIAMTGGAMSDFSAEDRKVLTEVSDDFIRKPFDEVRIRQIVEEFIYPRHKAA